ncbi:hypothetical protein DIZ27_30330 [Streptomyces sp. NWU339]|nr:hypothetical protein DIZ27_30330 [Streptomyces sp. NWU339]
MRSTGSSRVRRRPRDRPPHPTGRCRRPGRRLPPVRTPVRAARDRRRTLPEPHHFSRRPGVPA